MADRRPDIERVRQLAGAVGLPLEPGAEEELAPQYGLLVEYAVLLEALELEAEEPAWAFSLEVPEP